jgi:hypothetical protein
MARCKLMIFTYMLSEDTMVIIFIKRFCLTFRQKKYVPNLDAFPSYYLQPRKLQQHRVFQEKRNTLAPWREPLWTLLMERSSNTKLVITFWPRKFETSGWSQVRNKEVRRSSVSFERISCFKLVSASIKLRFSAFGRIKSLDFKTYFFQAGQAQI